MFLVEATNNPKYSLFVLVLNRIRQDVDLLRGFLFWVGSRLVFKNVQLELKGLLVTGTIIYNSKAEVTVVKLFIV
jgi:hypothetical protein